MPETYALTKTILNSNDTLTNAIKTIDIVHHEIHEGDHYKVFNRTTASDTQSAVLVTRTVVGSTRQHMVFVASARRGIEVNLYEGSTISGGTTLVAYNNDRNSTNAANAVFISNPAVGTTGTLIDNDQIGTSESGPQNASIGGNVQSRQEWILKTNAKTTYELRANSLGDDNIITLKAYFYEES